MTAQFKERARELVAKLESCPMCSRVQFPLCLDCGRDVAAALDAAEARGREAGLEEAAASCEQYHCDADSIYKPYDRCAPECMAEDYASLIRALKTAKRGEGEK